MSRLSTVVCGLCIALLSGCGGGGGAGSSSSGQNTGFGPLVVDWAQSGRGTPTDPTSARSLDIAVTSLGSGGQTAHVDADRTSTAAYQAAYAVPPSIPDG